MKAALIICALLFASALTGRAQSRVVAPKPIPAPPQPIPVPPEPADTRQPEIEESYDRFENVSTVKITESLRSSRTGYVLFVVMAREKGAHVSGRPATVKLGLTSKSTAWVYGKTGNDFRLILDGSERLNLGDMKRVAADVVSGGVLETLNLEIPFSTLEKLSKASTIEMRIGATEFELDSRQIEDLKAFVARFPK
jgi:hypothetical protein